MKFLDIFTLALIGSVILGVLLPATGQFAEVFGIVSDLGVGLLFFLHGARLSRAAVVAGITHWRLHLLVLATTFVLFPVIGLAAGLLPEALLPAALYPGVLFLCLLPSTVQSSIAFTSIAGGNVAAAVCSATASNILGMFLTPLLAGLFLGGQGAGFSPGTLGAILLQLLLPFVAGQLLQPWIGAFVARQRRVFAITDRGVILAVVYLAFSHAAATGLWQQLSVGGFVALILLMTVLLALVLAFTRVAARAFGFGREDEIAIVFCGSKKSLVSGVPMANVIFPAADVGMIVLPVMVFHQIQLLVCAALARRYAGSAARASSRAA